MKKHMNKSLTAVGLSFAMLATSIAPSVTAIAAETDSKHNRYRGSWYKPGFDSNSSGSLYQYVWYFNKKNQWAELWQHQMLRQAGTAGAQQRKSIRWK